MKRLGVIAVLMACSGGVPRVDPMMMIDPHGGDAGEQTSGCMLDSECGASQVCVNCGGTGACTPGCRENGQCATLEICQFGTVCQSCPCPPGWCVIDPCRDEDGDGYVPGDDPTVTCPGKQKGDCNDRNAQVHPKAAELCQNYIDDNCDGKRDEVDPECVCPAGQARCGNSWECGGVGTNECSKGCCQACNAGGNQTKPTCNFNVNYCAQRYGVNPYSGCSYGWLCDYCGSCPTTVDPVCGVNGSTYDNTCLMGLRHTKLLHRGACVPGEGIYCDGLNTGLKLDGGCGPSGELYCRSSCASGSSCGTSTCTKKGACVLDSDCPAGQAPPTPASCDAGSPVVACVDTACVSVCR